MIFSSQVKHEIIILNSLYTCICIQVQAVQLSKQVSKEQWNGLERAIILICQQQLLALLGTNLSCEVTFNRQNLAKK